MEPATRGDLPAVPSGRRTMIRARRWPCGVATVCELSRSRGERGGRLRPGTGRLLWAKQSRRPASSAAASAKPIAASAPAASASAAPRSPGGQRPWLIVTGTSQDRCGGSRQARRHCLAVSRREGQRARHHVGRGSGRRSGLFSVADGGGGAGRAPCVARDRRARVARPGAEVRRPALRMRRRTVGRPPASGVVFSPSKTARSTRSRRRMARSCGSSIRTAVQLNRSKRAAAR